MQVDHKVMVGSNWFSSTICYYLLPVPILKCLWIFGCTQHMYQLIPHWLVLEKCVLIYFLHRFTFGNCNHIVICQTGAPNYFMFSESEMYTRTSFWYMHQLILKCWMSCIYKSLWKLKHVVLHTKFMPYFHYLQI